MKHKNLIRLLSILSIVLFSLSSTYAQKSKLTQEDIPDAVIQALDDEYAGVKVLSWTLENNEFVANFKFDGLNTKAYFSTTGEWTKTLSAITKKELPSAITDYISNNYDSYIIENAYLQQKPKVKTHYLIEAHYDAIGAESSFLTFSDQGNLMERIDPENVTVAKPANANNAEIRKADNAQDKTPAAKTSATKQKNGKGNKNETVKKEDETIPASSVPEAVTKALTKKAQRPEDLKWYLKDSVYVAKCTTKAQANEIHITSKGLWQKTYVELAEEQVTGNMLKHLKAYYKGYKFADAKKELRADKQDKIYVSIYEKANYKQKLKTTIIFDKTGKLLKTIEADVQMGGGDAYDEDNDLDKYYSKIDKEQENGELKSKELPTDIRSYVSLNYPSYVYKSCTLISDNDFGEIYRIFIKADGISNLTETLYFNKEGKFLKKDESKVAAKVESSTDKNTAKVTDAPGISIPEPVSNAFKTKYPRVVSPEWEKNADGNYEVSFSSTKGKNFCIFAENGTLLETLSSLNPDNLTPNIASYINKNAKGAKVLEYYTVTKADKKKYYKVVIKTKKTNEIQTLWFNTAGQITK